MAEKEMKKTKPAGANERIDVTYTTFATNREKTEMRTGEGKDFDNEELLKMLGFEEKDGVLSLKATEHESELNEKGKVVRRTANNRVLTDDRQTTDIDR